MQKIDVKQVAQHLSELITLTVNGDEIIITQEGQPIVKLVAVKRVKPFRTFGSAKGLIKMSDDFNDSLEDFQEYM